MKKGLTMLVAVMVIFGLMSVIGSAAAANYVFVDSNVKGVGWKNTDYTVDTQPGIASGIEMRELESGTGIVTAQKWSLEVNKWDENENLCIESLDEKKIFDVEYFPITYQNLSYDQKWQEKKCVKNYEIGAVTDAYFDSCEKLQKEETVVTNTGLNTGGEAVFGVPKALTQTITADVLGKAHIGFAAKEEGDNHRTIAVGLEETIGDFSIEKTIDIRLNCSNGQIGEWLGCP